MSQGKIKYTAAVNKTCPYCQTKIKLGADFIICPECGTPHHKECWMENTGCTTFGCKENPLIKKESNEVIDVGNQTVEEIEQLITQTQQRHNQPVSNRLINCPECNSLIEENSRYCKFCGYNFAENQTPIRRNEFEKEFINRYKQRVSMQRKGGWLTLLSLFLLISVLILAGYFAIMQISEYLNSPREEIRSTVMDWKNAWEDKEIEKYQSYLADDYQYISAEANSREERKLNRQVRIERIKWTFSRYEYIKIDFSGMKVDIDPTDSTKAVVTVKEKYESDKYNDEGMKTFYMRKDTEGNWKIYKEVFEL